MSEDRLKSLFDEQLLLNKQCNPNFKVWGKDGMSQDMLRRLLLDHAEAMICEVSEMMETVGFKWWAKKPEFTSEVIHNIKVELIDILHFLIAAMQIIGMNDNEMWELYLKKNRLNWERQRKGYRNGTYQKIDAAGREDNYYLQKVDQLSLFEK